MALYPIVARWQTCRGMMDVIWPPLCESKKKEKKKRRHFLIMMHQRRQQPQVFLCLSHSIVPPSPGGEQDWRVKKPDHPPPPSNMPLLPTQQAEMKAETQGNLTCRPRVTIHFFFLIGPPLKIIVHFSGEWERRAIRSRALSHNPL